MYVQTHEKDEMQCLKRKRKDKQRKEKKSIAKERKEKEKEKNDEWGTKCLDQFCGIKWATQWKLRVEKCTK